MKAQRSWTTLVFALAALGIPASGSATVTSTQSSSHQPHHEQSEQQYVHVKACNTSESLSLVESLRLTHYSKRQDRIPGRRHLGITGADAQRVMPDMVHVVPRKKLGFDPATGHTVWSAQSGGVTHVVDHSHIFMHGVAATQELVQRQATLDAQLRRAERLNARHAAELEQLHMQTAVELSVTRLEKRRAAEAAAEKIRLEVEHEHVREEERRRTAAFERNESDALLRHRDLLARSRLQMEDEMTRSRNKQLVSMQEESSLKVEMLRRETEQQLRDKQLAADARKAELDRDAKLKQVKAEAEGRIRQERENEDVRLRQLRAQAEEDRKKLVEAVTTALVALGQGALHLLTDRQKLVTTIASLVALAAGIFAVREAARLVAREIEKRLGRPQLVRETSRQGGLRALASAVGAVFAGGGGGASGTRRAQLLRRQFGDVILAADLKERVESLTISIANARRHRAPFRHLMLYGPPGTGKTMVAKRLARGSGLDYAIMSGGDVGPLGADAVTQLHALFEWAAASPRGLLLFIDEAEAFLASRARRAMSEAQRNALNALLYQTGEQSSNFMMVLATNRPGDLDSAITDRVDEALNFPLPGLPQRTAMLKLYFDTYVTSTSQSRGTLWRRVQESSLLLGSLFATPVSGIQADALTPEFFVRVAHEVEGFSGREIAKLMVSAQGAAYGSVAGRLTEEMLLRVVRWKVAEHRSKERFAREGAAGEQGAAFAATLS